MDGDTLFDDDWTKAGLPKEPDSAELAVRLREASDELSYFRSLVRSFKAAGEKDWGQLVQSVIRQAMDLPEECRQSGDDSEFLDVWEEYCAQIQGEHSVLFGLYESTVEEFCEAEINMLPRSAQAVLWIACESFDALDFETAGGSMFEPNIDLLVEELHQRVRLAAANVELQTMEERLRSLAPWSNTVFGFLGDPGCFIDEVFAEASYFVSADPSEYQRMAVGLAADLLSEMELDRVPTYEFGNTVEEQQAFVAGELEQFFHAWRAAAKEKFGNRLGLD